MKTKAQKLPENQVQHSVHLDTGGHFLHFTEDTNFQHNQSTNHNCFLYLREHFSRWTNTHFTLVKLRGIPTNTCNITQHLAPVTIPLKRHCQRRHATWHNTLKDLGLSVQVVLAPTPFHLLPVVFFTGREWDTHHLNLTAYKGWQNNTKQANKQKSLHSCQTDVNRQTASLNMSVFLWAASFLSRLAAIVATQIPNTPPTNWHVWRFTRLQLNHWRHCKQHDALTCRQMICQLVTP